MSRLRQGIVAGVVVALALGTWGFASAQARADEWEHGGDRVDVAAEVWTTIGADAFAEALTAWGGPDQPPLQEKAQQVLVRVAWSAPEDHEGTYTFLLLDARLGDPLPLTAYAAWNDAGDVSLGWDSRYAELADHYDWLGRLANRDDAWIAPSEPVSESGSISAVFDLGRRSVPTTYPDRQLVLGLVHTDEDGTVRWARPVPLSDVTPAG